MPVFFFSFSVIHSVLLHVAQSMNLPPRWDHVHVPVCIQTFAYVPRHLANYCDSFVGLRSRPLNLRCFFYLTYYTPLILEGTIQSHILIIK